MSFKKKQGLGGKGIGFLKEKTFTLSQHLVCTFKLYLINNKRGILSNGLQEGLKTLKLVCYYLTLQFENLQTSVQAEMFKKYCIFWQYTESGLNCVQMVCLHEFNPHTQTWKITCHLSETH